MDRTPDTQTETRYQRSAKPTIRITPISHGCQRYYADVSELASVAAVASLPWRISAAA